MPVVWRCGTMGEQGCRWGVGMPYEPVRHQRRSIRLVGYDYAQGGAYFVTICVQGRACLLGEIVEGEVRLSAAGEAVARCWEDLPDHFPTVELDACAIMPNHVHGIIFLTESRDAGAACAPLSHVVGAFKSFSARRINALRGVTGSCWQRGYYEHIIRNERSLARLREYVAQNPARWELDRLHPDAPEAW